MLSKNKIEIVRCMKSLYKNFFNFLKDYACNWLSYHLNYPFIKPWRVNFDITQRCPLKCIMCGVWKKKPLVKNELTLEELKKIVDEIYGWGIDHISLAGGETLVRANDVIELIKYASKKPHMRIDLITNAYYLNKKLCEKLIKSGISKISLSLDGATPKTHDFIRGKGNFKQVLNAAKILLKLKKRYQSDVELEFTTVVMSYNFRELIDIFNLMQKIGFDYINYQAVVPDNTFSLNLDEIKKFYETPLWIKEEDLPLLEKIVKKLVLLKKKTGKIRNTRRYLLNLPKYFKFKEKFKVGKCMVGYSYLNIDPYGNINVCGLGPNLNVKNFSNLTELWKHKKYKLTRIKIKNCKRPCLMLCYEKLNFKELLEAWLEVRGWI
jgi:MoaA/NifB/PqqE/SkfB family radical SAM enzyme